MNLAISIYFQWQRKDFLRGELGEFDSFLCLGDGVISRAEFDLKFPDCDLKKMERWKKAEDAASAKNYNENLAQWVWLDVQPTKDGKPSNPKLY